MIRGIRGATTVENNHADEIVQRSAELLKDLVQQNGIQPDDIVSVFFTVTEDVTEAFPAKSIRELEGWTYVPVMCMREIPVPDSLQKCIRVMVTAETTKDQADIHHIYHHEAQELRPDLKR
ncbi:chorismate mutase [Halobacillus yeomjeoni]|uniref:chorismate mutase n=1 Tax=Halobacillus yeomjeoni TaxID=311194 RepID=UPI001CD261C8|nr:chorismate mutase [Halobacillus yeomjeoni]MCA0983025.1 chorismate mutase [Halobacillus yeomjeoni]